MSAPLDRPPIPPPPSCLAPWREAVVELPGLAPVPARLYGERRCGQAAPLVVHFHGGAFTAGGLDCGVKFASVLAGAGAVVASIAYPLAPAHPFPQAIEVGYGVLQWAWRQRTRLAGAGAPVFLAGEEAGGNLAAATALIARDRAHPPLAGQILVSPMLDPCVGMASVRAGACADAQDKWAAGWRQYLRCPRDASHPYAVPGASLRLAGIAPTLVLTSRDDPLRDEACAFAERLRQAGVAVEAEVLAPATGWPGSLLASEPMECGCAAAVREQLRGFFAACAPQAA
ncbi:alpha/beta hydrolase [Pseudorhodoferax sp.]|uniref:alpha/beta hydrolase n=1 Tax=Pseudorhodoferax sp. TaxID=1993553 RepID=UPI0039E5235D